MKNLRITLWLCSLLLLTTPLLAEHVPVQQARQVAAAFLQRHTTRSHGSAVLPHQLQLVYDGETSATRASGQYPAYYVFNHSGGHGFVMVAADDLVTPILGYSHEHSFHAQDMPANLRRWLADMRAQVQHIRTQGQTASSQVTQQWALANTGTVVRKLLTANWDQAKPYWDLCPQYLGQRTLTGCVATSLAIVMRYHEWPQRGTGILPGYTTETYKLRIPARQLGHEYKWSFMPLTVKNNISQQQAHEIATLMYDCGVLVQADYHLEGTAALHLAIANPLIENMDYDKGLYWAERHAYNSAQWLSLLKQELNANRPILYAGADKQATTGHAFVLDGYTTADYFSVNWGWSGMCNGFYKLDAFLPDEPGLGGGNGDFSYFQSALLGVQKNVGNPRQYMLRFIPYVDDNGKEHPGLQTRETNFQKDKVFELEFGALASYGTSFFQGKLRLVVVDAQGRIRPNSFLQSRNGPVSLFELGITAHDNIVLGSYFSFASALVSIPIPIHEGDALCLAYQGTGSTEWQLVEGNEEEGCVWKLPLTHTRQEIPLDRGTQLHYIKTERRLQVTVPDQTTVQLLDSDQQPLSSRVQQTGNQAQIDVSKLPAGTYRLKLTRGSDTYTVELKF